jgi:epoxyqueuosine reductase
MASRWKIGSGDAQRFDQKNIMYRRALWDPTVQDFAPKFYAQRVIGDNPGYTLKEWAFVHAAWYVERAVAKGNQSGNFGLYKWEVDPREFAIVTRLIPGQKYEVTDPAQMSRDIKRVAKFLGAAVTGICRLDRRWVYSHGYSHAYDGTMDHYPIEVPAEYEYAIVMAVEMDYMLSKTSPGGTILAAGADGYSKMAFVAGRLAHFIRILGYRAIPSGNDTALNIPLAIDAGLGQLGRHGILITEKFGPRVRLCKVFTDLPLVTDEPIDFGVTEFCDSCKLCAENCPAQAISFGEPTDQPRNISNNGGILKWYIDAEKCLWFWVQNHGFGCGNCIRVCPFNKTKGILHDSARLLVRNASWLDPLLLRLDKLFGYGKRAKAEQFWASLDR